MPKSFMLVGVPGSGKSTWVKNQTLTDNCVVVSTDEFVEQYASECGKTYSEVFQQYMPTAINLMAKKVVEARKMKKDIIWDQTSTTVASRRRKFNMLTDYEHIAIIFSTPSNEELIKRLEGRPGKNIPWNVVSEMINNFQIPNESEGFIKVLYNN